jgi:predicted membrane protein
MKRIFQGVLFILSAAFVVVSQMGYLGVYSIWEALLIAFLAIIVLNGIFIKRSFCILIPISLLVILFKAQIGIANISSWTIIIAAILLAIGLSIIFRKGHCSCKMKNKNFKKETRDENNIDINVSMGSSIQYITSEDLESVNISCKLGELNVFFDEANIKEKEVTVHLNIALAGVELYVPKSWEIVNNVSTNLAEVEDNNRKGNKNKKLILTGSVSLGALKIIYID